jgi:microsomal dipeptidase-like Zn-dependent dipeptidase
VFPQDLIQPKLTQCPAVYSLIVDKGHVAVINGIDVICLGHDFKDGILNHAYFGSEKVVKDAQKMKGWREGLICLKAGCLQKGDDGLVKKIV